MVDRFEREYLHRLLAVHEGNVTRSAREAGMNRSAFQRLMRKHHLRSSAYRAAAEVQRP
jgi:transcriptional regulator of acetoin/glycerol metabolism